MKKREKLSKIIIVFFVIFLIWALIQVFAPIVLTTNSVKDLSGNVAVTDNKLAIDEMGFPINLVYSFGDVLCHQRAERSLFINGNQMPFCARCTAIWFGLAIGLCFMVFFQVELDKKFLLLIIIGLLPIGIDGLGQLFGLWESNNLTRILTGLLIGVICGISIGIILDEIREIRASKKIKS